MKSIWILASFTAFVAACSSPERNSPVRPELVAYSSISVPRDRVLIVDGEQDHLFSNQHLYYAASFAAAKEGAQFLHWTKGLATQYDSSRTLVQEKFELRRKGSAWSACDVPVVDRLPNTGLFSARYEHRMFDQPTAPNVDRVNLTRRPGNPAIPISYWLDFCDVAGVVREG